MRYVIHKNAWQRQPRNQKVHMVNDESGKTYCQIENGSEKTAANLIPIKDPGDLPQCKNCLALVAAC